ncbi:MAG: hypothetical protein V1678_02870 [Candidatus Aenigmatarchaeota archaeon]
MKYLVKTSDGRTLVKSVEVETKPKEKSNHFPERFLMIEAYEERCISSDDSKEASLNLNLIARYAGPGHPMRKKYDPVVVGSFTPFL